MLMEALAPSSHVTMWAVLRQAVSLPAYGDGYPAFEKGLPGQPGIYAVHDLLRGLLRNSGTAGQHVLIGIKIFIA